jgi:hypothetical protein
VEATPLPSARPTGTTSTLGRLLPADLRPGLPGQGPEGERPLLALGGKLFDPGYYRAARRRALQARVESYARPIAARARRLPRHIAKTTKDIAFREAALSVHKLLLDDTLRAEMQSRAPGEHEQMLSWLRDSVNDLSVPENGAGSWLQGMSKLRSNVTAGIFAFNIGQTLQNLSGFSTATRHVGAGHMLDSLMTFAKDASGTIDKIHELSPEMRGNALETQSGVGESLRELQDRSGPLARVTEWGLAMFATTDNFVRYRSWWAAFQKGLAEGRPQEEAVRSADQMVRLKVMSGSTKDLPALTRSPVGKLFAPLMGFAINRVNQIWGSVADARVASSDGHKWAAAKILGATLVALALEDIVSELVTGKGPQDANSDGEVTAIDWAAWTAKTAVLAVPKKVPILGTMIRSMESNRDASFNPEARVLTELGKAGTGAWKLATQDEPIDVDQVLTEAGRVLEFVGWAKGLPTAQASTTVKYLRAWNAGEENPSGPIEAGLGIAFGKKRPGKLAAAIE